MGKNILYSDNAKVFTDTNGNRISARVSLESAFTISDAGSKHLPRTIVTVNVLPKVGQSVPAFMKMLGGNMREAYDAAVMERTAIVVDKELSNGVQIGYHDSFYPVDNTLRRFDEASVGAFLKQYVPFVDSAVAAEVSEFIVKETSAEKREEAESAYKRTGGRGTSAIAK